jgi:hypothetical protein
MRTFLLLWFGESISAVGSGMTSFAVGIYVWQQTNSALWVSLSALFAFLPTILLSPFAAVLADRFDRRLLMLWGDLLSIIGVVIVLLSVLGKSSSMIPLLIGVGVSAVLISPVEPAYKASVSDFLSPDDYARASGMVQIASSSRYLVSPVLAGILIGLVGIEWILLIDISTFFVTAFTVTMVRKSDSSKPVAGRSHSGGNAERLPTKFENSASAKIRIGYLSDFREGFRAISSDVTVRTLIVLMAFMCFFVGFIQVLMTPMVLSFTGEKELGVIESLSALGMLVSAIIIGISRIGKRLTAVLRVGLITAALSISLIGFRENPVWIVLFGFLFFFSLPWINTAAEVMIRKRIPNALQARAWGLIGLLTQIGYVGAYILSGPGADFLFEPLMLEKGALAASLGKIIGVGPGRGIAVMLLTAGIGMALVGWILTMRLKKTDMVLT